MTDVNDFDKNVNYDSLKQQTYPDTPGEVFFTCPKCGCEYLAIFIVSENGKPLCIDCWGKRNSFR